MDRGCRIRRALARGKRGVVFDQAGQLAALILEGNPGQAAVEGLLQQPGQLVSRLGEIEPGGTYVGDAVTL